MTLELLHFDPEVVPLAGPLADAGEDRVAAVLHGHVVDELLDDDRLAHARAAEEADLAALEERLDEVDDLDPGLEHLEPGALLVEAWAARGGWDISSWPRSGPCGRRARR